MKPDYRRAATAIGAAAASAILFYLGTGLRPWPFLTWFAPLPVLLMAPRVNKRGAFGLAAAAWLAGESQWWGYFINTLQIPPPIAVLIIVGSALVFGLVVLLVRALICQRRQFLAAVVFPAAWVTVEFGMTYAAPFGAWWSLAYTQADVLPVVQIVSVTGVWGITFLLFLVPAAGVAVIAPRNREGGPEWGWREWRRWRPAVAVAVVLAVVVGYGSVRLSSAHGASGQRVALVGSDREIDPTAIDTPAGAGLLTAYVGGVEALTVPDVRVVVLPEKAFLADAASLPALTGPLARLARERRFDIVVGLVLMQDGKYFNEAIDLPADGGTPVTYFKQHLVKGVEDELTAGNSRAYVAGQRDHWGLAICFDLDFPALVRHYRDDGVSALFVPAWDFGRDAWLHSRMAVTRGVENGMTIARAAKQGALTLSDPYGRVIAEGRTSGASVVTVTAWLPSGAPSTLYTHLGDWLAWACVILFLVGLAVAYRGRPRTGSRGTL